MSYTRAKHAVEKIIQLANIGINGQNSYDIQVVNSDFYSSLLRNGALGLGESYMKGWWHCEQIDEMICRVMSSELEKKVKENYKVLFQLIGAKILNLQSKRRADIVAKKHYDIGNDLFERMLDKNMNYTCAYWKDTNELEKAQTQKLELTCQKLKLKSGMTILDIGCGWGSFAKYAAQNYGAHVVGISISKEQIALGKKLCKGLPIEIRFQDYRDVTEQFDRIVSMGMFEHVGPKNYRTYMQVAYRCLKDQGLFLLHTIGSNKTASNSNSWINKYIFPNAFIPSVRQISKNIESLFTMEDWHNFGSYYDKTLVAWHNNFENYWNELKSNYNERFRRMWNFYLLSCAGAFRARELQLWQIVLSKGSIPGVYQSVR